MWNFRYDYNSTLPLSSVLSVEFPYFMCNLVDSMQKDEQTKQAATDNIQHKIIEI